MSGPAQAEIVLKERNHENPFGSQVATREAQTTLGDVEQSRAIAETQGAMVIAKRFPRDQVQAMDRILNACSRQTLAEGGEIKGQVVGDCEQIDLVSNYGEPDDYEPSGENLFDSGDAWDFDHEGAKYGDECLDGSIEDAEEALRTRPITDNDPHGLKAPHAPEIYANSTI